METQLTLRLPIISERRRAYNREYRIKNRHKLAAYLKKNAERIRGRLRAATKRYRLRHRAKVLATQRAWHKRTYRANPQHRLKMLVNTAAKRMVRSGWTKRHRCAEMIGCTWEQLRTHLESQFKSGMTWDNQGQFGWHIDHIRPLSSFDLTQPGQMAAAMHYTNLQPLWWRENIVKGGKWEQCG